MSLKQKPFAPLRIIIVGARVESAVDGYWWHFIAKLFQTKYYYPCFHIYLVGPEVVFTKTMTADAEKYGVDAASRTMDRQMQITAIKCRYEDIHDALGPFDPY